MKDSILKLSTQLNELQRDIEFNNDFYVDVTELTVTLCKQRNSVGEQLRVLLEEYCITDLRSARNLDNQPLVIYNARRIARIRSTNYDDLLKITNQMFNL